MTRATNIFTSAIRFLLKNTSSSTAIVFTWAVPTSLCMKPSSFLCVLTLVAETEVFDKIRRVLSGNLYIEDQLRIRLAYFRSTKGPDATEEYRLLGRVMQAKHFRPSGNEFGSDLWHQYSEDFHDLCSNSQIIASAKALARDTAKGVKPKT